MLIVFVSLFSVVLAADPRPCCMGDKYTAVLKSVSGSMTVGSAKGQMADDLIEVHYDFNRSMIVAVSNEVDQNTGIRGKNMTVIYDFVKGRQFILPESGRCFTQTLDANSFPAPCMAQNLTFVNSYWIGSASKRIKVNGWTGQFGPYHASISLTENDCTPIGYTQYGDNKQSIIFQAFLFTNIIRDQVNDALFTLPQECNYPVFITGIGKRDTETFHFRHTPFYMFSQQCMMFDNRF